MKRLVATLSLLAVASVAFANNDVSKEKGKELFASSKLGTNGKSCSSCHPDGKGMVKVASEDADELATIINKCTTKALAGKALVPSSAEMKSLVMYIKSFAP